MGFAFADLFFLRRKGSVLQEKLRPGFGASGRKVVPDGKETYCSFTALVFW